MSQRQGKPCSSLTQRSINDAISFTASYVYYDSFGSSSNCDPVRCLLRQISNNKPNSESSDGLDSSELSQWELSSSLDPSGGLLQAKRPAERLYNRAFHNPFSSAKIKDPFGPHSHVNAGRLSHDDQPPTVEERALVQESPSQTTIGIPQASSKSIMNIPVAATSDIPTLSATLEAPTPSNLSLVAQKNTTSSAINPDDPPPDVRYSSHINACHLFTKPKLEEREAKKKDDQPYDHPQEHGNTGSL